MGVFVPLGSINGETDVPYVSLDVTEKFGSKAIEKAEWPFVHGRFVVASTETTKRRKAFPMRLREAELRGRVNANLELRFGERRLTSYAGLELMRRYFGVLGLSGKIRRIVGEAVPGTDYGVVSMIMVILALLISGGRRVRHLLYLEGDPVVLRNAGARSVS